MKRRAGIFGVLALAATWIPGAASAQFVSLRGLLEERYGQYFVDDPSQDFSSGSFNQNYRLNLGGEYGLSFLDMSDLGVLYSSGKDASLLVGNQGGANESQFGYNGRVQLSLPWYRGVSVSPYYQYNRVDKEAAAGVTHRIESTTGGGTLSLRLDPLPSYTASWWRTVQEVTGTASVSRLEITELFDRATYRVGVLEAEYEHRDHLSRDLAGSAPESANQTWSGQANLSDRAVDRWGLASYQAQGAWRRWSSRYGAVESGRQDLSTNLQLVSQSLPWLGLDHSLRAGQVYHRGLDDGNSDLSHLAALQSMADWRMGSASNRLEAAFSGGGVRYVDAVNIDQRYLEGEATQHLNFEESWDEGSRRERVTQQLRWAGAGRAELSSEQSYVSAWSGAGGWSQTLGIGAEARWPWTSMANFILNYRLDDSLLSSGGGQSVDSGGFKMELSPLMDWSNSAQYWITHTRGVETNTHLVYFESRWVPDRHWTIRAGSSYSWDNRVPAVPGRTASASNYWNYDASARYHLGKTDFELKYERNERDYANAYHYLGLGLTRKL